MPSLECDEEKKEGTGFKILPQKNLLTRRPILALVKSDKYCIFCNNTEKSLKTFITI